MVRRNAFAKDESSRDQTSATNLVLLLLSLTITIFLLPRIGFASATLAFAILWMLRLRVSWKLCLPLALALIGVIEVLFRSMFKVQLPEGTMLSLDLLLFTS